MQIESLVLGAFEANCFVVWEDPASSLIVDPGADGRHILKFLSEHRLSPKVCLLTHGHADHISAAYEIANATQITTYLHKADLTWAFTKSNCFLPFYPTPTMPGNGIVPLPADESILVVGGMEVKIIYTPGHTPGSVCFLFHKQNILFSGDTLFAGSVGRTDLNGGDSRQLEISLKRLSSLHGSVVVYSGHGPRTTIEREKKTNFFMRSVDNL